MNKQTIKMVAFNPDTRRTEEVFPESEVELCEMTPLFYCQSANTFVTVPGVAAEDVYTDWVAQVNS